MEHFADHALGGDHGHVGRQFIKGSFVDKDGTRLLAATRSDDLRGCSFRNELLFESQQHLQAACLFGILTEAQLLHLEALDLLLELAILGTNAAQVEIIPPDTGDSHLCIDDTALERRHEIKSPDANQAGALVVCGALDLNGQA